MRTAQLYVMRRGDLVKLGVSCNPERRRREIGSDVELLFVSRPVDDADRVERLAHRVLVLHASHERGEWFRASLSDAKRAIKVAIRQAVGVELELGGRVNTKGTPTLYPIVWTFPVNDQFYRDVDDLRRRERDVPSRSEMLRRLVQRNRKPTLKKAG